MRKLISSTFLSLFLLSSIVTFAGNDIKSTLNTAIEQIKTNTEISKNVQTSYANKLNALLNKMNDRNDSEMLKMVIEEYRHLSDNFTKVTGVVLPEFSEE